MSATPSEHEILGLLKSERLGPNKSVIADLVQPKFVAKLATHFSMPLNEVIFGLKETLRFIYLAATTDSNLFFPGNDFLDEIWHQLILETKTYRKICDSFSPGSFVDHTGIPLSDYLNSLSSELAKQEQMTWIVEYVKAFGALTPESYAVLPMARGLGESMGIALDELNSIVTNFASINLFPNIPATLEGFADEFLKGNSEELNDSPRAVKSAIGEYFRYAYAHRSDRGNILSFAELELLHQFSSAFAFTLAQHLAAYDRLSYETEWQKENADLWKSIYNGNILCGSATTHILKPNASVLIGVKNEDGFYFRLYSLVHRISNFR